MGGGAQKTIKSKTLEVQQQGCSQPQQNIVGLAKMTQFGVGDVGVGEWEWGTRECVGEG